MAICCLTHVRYTIQLLSKLMVSQKAEGEKKNSGEIPFFRPPVSLRELYWKAYGGIRRRRGGREGEKARGGKNNRPRSLSPPSPIRASSFQSRHSWAIICLSVDLICHFNYLSVCVSFVNVCVEGKRSCVWVGTGKSKEEQRGTV